VATVSRNTEKWRSHYDRAIYGRNLKADFRTFEYKHKGLRVSNLESIGFIRSKKP
jgi:hypothetical protein